MTHSIRIEFTDGSVEWKSNLTSTEADHEYRVPDQTGLVYSVTVLDDGKPLYGWVRKGQAS